QVRQLAFFFEFRLQRGESFDDADQVLVRADPSGVKQERIVDKVALGENLPIGVRSVTVQETLVDGVIDDFDPRWGDPEQLLDLTLGETRNGKNPSSPFQYSPRQVEM